MERRGPYRKRSDAEAPDLRRMNPGRPIGTFDSRHPDMENVPPGPETLVSDCRVWVEGETRISSVDDEGFVLRDKIAQLLVELSARKDEFGKTHGEIKLCFQPLKNINDRGLRRRAWRQNSVITENDMVTFISYNPAMTAKQISDNLNPADASEHDSRASLNKTTMMLRRLVDKGLVDRRAQPYDRPRFYAESADPHYTEREAKFAEALVQQLGGRPFDYAPVVKLIATFPGA